jgi:uncharacterized membrane protein
VATDERRTCGWLLAAVTLLGLGLRVWHLNSDLWLDEISPLVDYRDVSAWQVVTTHTGFYSHLLNTLLVKASVGVFGEQAWAVRLPAMLWGTATIPVFYRVARLALSRRASLTAALLLALSYHHIFFSQSARGYSAYVFLSLVSSGLLVKVLGGGAPRIAGAYVMASALNLAALLIGGVVVAAHGLISAISVFLKRRQGVLEAVLVKRLLLMFALTALLGGVMYAAVLPTMLAMVRPVYADPASGFAPLSLSLLVELVRGVAAGLGPVVWGVVPAVALAFVGYLSLLRRQWILTLSLTIPVLLQALIFGSMGLTFYPRLFILGLPLALLVAVHTVTLAAAYLTRVLGRGDDVAWGLRMAGVVLLCAASIAILPGYYASPKQPYRASLDYVEAVRQPEALVIAIHYAEGGVRYHVARAHPDAEPHYHYVRTDAALDALVAESSGRPIWLVTTFARALRLGEPELDGRIRRDWEIDRTFRGTVGDGDISIWRPRASPAP